MRQSLLLFGIVLALATSGCGNRNAQIISCVTAEAALAAYIADLEAGESPNAQTIARAKSAAAFLATYCGYVYAGQWVDDPTTAPPVSRSVTVPPAPEDPSFDGNGVMIVRRR